MKTSRQSTWIGVVALVGMLSSSTIAFAMPCGGDCHEVKSTSCCDYEEQESSTGGESSTGEESDRSVSGTQSTIASVPMHGMGHGVGCCEIRVGNCDDFPLKTDYEVMPPAADAGVFVRPAGVVASISFQTTLGARAPPHVPVRNIPTKTIVLLI